jgi:2'-5' RNA ligase
MRLFFGMQPSREARQALSEFCLGEGRTLWDRAIRPVPAENIHLTVKFLGAVDGAVQVERLVESVGGAAVRGARPLRLAAVGLGAFPPRGRVRVVWSGVGGDVDGLRSLQASVEAAVERVGIPREPGPWTPHWTLGRARASGPPASTFLRERLHDAGRDENGGERTFGEPFDVARLVLFESVISTGGARYVERASWELGGSEGAGEGT